MYCMKGSWVGQTFALAASSDSGGRKPRIRRSKEERKSMVESFIKRYQSLNNGNFPSLNLTHKEVGGSFYTVREIVREIIQDNRVLGPGHFSSEEQKDDIFAINYPLGTISSDPHTVNEVDGFSTKEGKESVVLSLDTTEQKKETFDVNVNINNSHAVNHIDTNQKSDASNNLLVESLRESNTSEIDGESGQTGSFEAKLTLPTEDVEVETFPLRHAVKKSDNSDEASVDSKKIDAHSYNSESKIVTLSNSTLAVDKDSSVETSSDRVTDKAADSSEAPVLGESPDLIIKDAKVKLMVMENGEVNLENLPIKDDNDSLHNQMNHIPAHGDSTATNSEQNNIKTMNASSGITYFENSEGTSRKNAEEAAIINGIDLKKDERAVVGSLPLNRIDLESWRASKQEKNPLLAFFKAFIDAFSKFLSQ